MTSRTRRPSLLPSLNYADFIEEASLITDRPEAYVDERIKLWIDDKDKYLFDISTGKPTHTIDGQPLRGQEWLDVHNKYHAEQYRLREVEKTYRQRRNKFLEWRHFTIRELRDECRRRGLTRYVHLTKEHLIIRIINDEAKKAEAKTEATEGAKGQASNHVSIKF